LKPRGLGGAVRDDTPQLMKMPHIILGGRLKWGASPTRGRCMTLNKAI